MPVRMELIENGRAFRYVFSDPWRIDDFTNTFAQAQAILDSSPYLVHGVVNLLATAKDPLGVLNIRKHPSFHHTNSGYTVFCHGSLLARRITETALRIARFDRMKFFDSEAEGLAFVRELMAQEDLAGHKRLHTL